MRTTPLRSRRAPKYRVLAAVVILASGGCSAGNPSVQPTPALEASIASTMAPGTESPPPATHEGDNPNTSPPDPIPPPVNEEAALTKAVADYTDAFFAADYETAVTGTWSARCLADDEKLTEARSVFDALSAMYPDASARPKAQNTVIDRIENTIGIVTYDYVSSSESGSVTSQPWVLEDGQWKFDAC
ncbi:MAG: hypothetical protein FWD59_04030 [Micrococcales bacterium]|nr:hypothetical protein [Micrococcales bacterium]